MAGFNPAIFRLAAEVAAGQSNLGRTVAVPFRFETLCEAVAGAKFRAPRYLGTSDLPIPKLRKAVRRYGEGGIMSGLNCDTIVTPACPVCASPTRLKEQRRRSQDAIICVFKCTACEVEYPMHHPEDGPEGRPGAG